MAENATILRQVNKEVEDFRSKLIQIIPGLYFNQRDTLYKVLFYYNSKFSTGDVDDDGDKKYFFNINKSPCFVYTKSIDFDTKNIKLLTADGGDSLKTWFMERDLKYWMKDKQFGKVLNRLFKELPIFGSVVIKIVKGEPFFVDLRNFIVEQSADSLDVSNFIIEIHNQTVPEFRKIAKQMKWSKEDVDKVIEEFHQMKDTSHIRLYERYGEVAEQAADGTMSYPYKRVFIADVGIDQYDQHGNLLIRHSGVELSSEDWEGHPYWEFHADKMPGRWLGTGVVEQLFEPQVRQNEIVNLQSKTSYWAALRLFWSQDTNLAGNLMAEHKNGDVLTGDSPVVQIDMSDRNLAFFNEETQKWMGNRDELSFDYSIMRGQGVSGGRSATTSAMAAQMAGAYFDLIKENIALDIKEMIYTVIIPQFEKDSTPEHTLRLVGQDLDMYIQMVRNDLVTKEVIRLAISGKHFPTSHDAEVIGVAVEQSIKQGKEKMLTIPKGYYANLKYDVDIDITGESVDVKERSAAKFAILQAITADPTMTTDPVKRKVLYGIAEDAGINPNDFFGIDAKPTLNPMNPDAGVPGGQIPQAPQALAGGRAGGGVSKPVFGAAIPGKATKTL